MCDLVPDKDWQIIDDDEIFWQNDHNISERELDLDHSEIEKEGAHEIDDSKVDI